MMWKIFPVFTGHLSSVRPKLFHSRTPTTALLAGLTIFAGLIVEPNSISIKKLKKNVPLVSLVFHEAEQTEIHGT